MRTHYDGLTSNEASQRLGVAGPNVIISPPGITFWNILWEELREPMILLLLIVGVLYSLLGEPGDAITIFAVILLLALAEVQNEYRAKKAIQRLSEITSPRATVMRDGLAVQIDAAAIVPGDLLILAPGTKAAADATMLDTVGIHIDEASITGESFPAEKAVGDEVYAGTVVVVGDGIAEVSATGKATRLGTLAEGLKTVRPPKTPLQKAMKDLSGRLVWAAVAFSVTIPLIGLLQGRPLDEMLLIGLSLSFATIPEEMPIIITMVLGLGSYRLSKKGFLVRRLAAAESMGSVSVIVTDKTGTLTESRMTLTGISSLLTDEDAVAAALGAVSAIDATPIDLALMRHAEVLGVPFDSREIVRKRDLGDGSKTRAVLREDGTLFVSGAPEQVFERCAFVPDSVRDTLDTETAKGSRLIAVALAKVTDEKTDVSFEELERDLGFIALLIFSDPLRPEVPGAIAAMKDAGVRTIMVTGDHPATAAAIALKAGIGDGTTAVVTGDALNAMDDQALGECVGHVSVFARTTAQHKYRIVAALQRAGLSVAVTGDGINDALAIKAADIGIAMGVRGTDVAKEAADAVLADDDYATIAHAVFEGRSFHDNLRKGVKYYLSVKAALILVFLLPALFGLPLPFSPVQIILLELFMDLAASAGFVAEPAEGDIRTRRPEAMSTNILDAPQLKDLFVKSVFLFVPVIAAYGYAMTSGMTVDQQGSLAFLAWMVGHVALAFVSRSDRQPLAGVGVFSNKVVNIWALATAVFLAISFGVPGIAMRLDLSALPIRTALVTPLLVVAWMSLLEVRKHVSSRTPHLIEVRADA
ncbi:MAG TPA: ATPase [Coriobacteriia bacterium]|nr:MAG: Putative cation-transporting ATPase [Actinobacteria bacterium 66_15]HAL30096.1 ATPase [Coriobacteriia bacterium]